MDDVIKVVKKENGEDNHIALISLLFNDSFLLNDGRVLHDHRAIYPLLSLLPYPLMVYICLYLHKDELLLKEMYIKKYGNTTFKEVNILDPLTILTLNINVKKYPIPLFLPKIIHSFLIGNIEECNFLMGLHTDINDIDSLVLVKKIEILIERICPSCDKEVIDSILDIISFNDKVKALSILLKSVLLYKSKDSYTYLMNKLVLKEENT